MGKGIFLGNNIKKARILKGYTQTELGDVLGIPKQIVFRIENNQRKLSDKELEKLSSFLNIPLNFLLEEKYIDDLLRKQYKPKNKWQLEVPPFIDDILDGLEEHFDYLVNAGHSNPRMVINDIENIIKAFKLFLNEYKEKNK